MDGITVKEDPTSGMVDTHLRLRYHAKAVYALMGVEGMEYPGKMCADGTHGSAKGGASCRESCYHLAGVDGLCVPLPSPPLLAQRSNRSQSLPTATGSCRYASTRAYLLAPSFSSLLSGLELCDTQVYEL